MEMTKIVERLRQYNHNKDEVLWRTLIGNITLEELQATDTYKSHYDAHHTLTEESPMWLQNLAREYCDAARRGSRYRRLCTTQNGYFGAIPETAQVGDSICMLEGGRLLFTVRPMGNDFVFVGPAYIHGFMYGEILKLDWYRRRMLTLV
jgi:hypothetical protein